MLHNGRARKDACRQEFPGTLPTSFMHCCRSLKLMKQSKLSNDAVV